MPTHPLDFLRVAIALILGGAIGAGFGIIQNLARSRHERRQQQGKLKNGWTLMPGSGARVAYLLVALAAVQVLCPLLFADGTQWWVSGGLAAGYGWTLFRQIQQLRRRRA